MKNYLFVLSAAGMFLLHTATVSAQQQLQINGGFAFFGTPEIRWTREFAENFVVYDALTGYNDNTPIAGRTLGVRYQTRIAGRWHAGASLHRSAMYGTLHPNARFTRVHPEGTATVRLSSPRSLNATWLDVLGYYDLASGSKATLRIGTGLAISRYAQSYSNYVLINFDESNNYEIVNESYVHTDPKIVLGAPLSLQLETALGNNWKLVLNAIGHYFSNKSNSGILTAGAAYTW